MTSPKANRLSMGLVLFALGVGVQQGWAADPIVKRNEHDSHAIQRWANLPHDRQLLVLKALGVTVPQAFYNCVCASAGYGSSGTSQYYHPDTIGDYNKTYSCQHPGPPCIVSGFGCTRHDLPRDTKIYEQCARKDGLDGGNPLDNILKALSDRAIRKGLAGNPVAMDAPEKATWSPVDCAKQRKDAGIVERKSIAKIPLDRRIYTLSQESIKDLGGIDLKPELKSKLVKLINQAIGQMDEKLSDFGHERDLRFDFGFMEVGAGFDRETRTVHLSEIVIKKRLVGRKTPLIGDLSLDGETAITFRPSNGANPEEFSILGQKVKGGKLGFSFETKYGEVKYGLDIQPNNQATDYYGGWQKPSEYRLLNGLENLLSKLDFYDGAAVNAVSIGNQPGTNDPVVKIGPEITLSGRESYTEMLFSDMYAALDNMLDNQKRWEEQRHDYIAAEAKRFGFDRRCFTTGELISLTNKAYQKQKQGGASITEPFLRFKTGKKKK